MQVRDITKEDLLLFETMCTDFYNSDAVLLPMASEKIHLTFKEALNGSPFLRLVFIEHDNQVAGYALFAFYWSNEAGGMVAQIEEIYILPLYRGQGLGHAFFDWCLENYQDSMARLRLEACRHNQSALKLYQSFGFEILDYLQMIRDINKSSLL